MTDRDDALRRELGWTGPEETDFEPPTAEAGTAHSPQPTGALRGRLSTSFRRIEGRPRLQKKTTSAQHRHPADGRRRPRAPNPARAAANPTRLPPPFLDTERPGGSFRQTPRYGPPPGSPRDTGPLPTMNRPDDGTWNQQAAWQAATCPRVLRDRAASATSIDRVHRPVNRGRPALRPRSDRRRRPRRPRPMPTGSEPTTWCPHARCRPAAAGVSRCTRPPSGWSISASQPTRSGRPSWRARSSRCFAGTTRSA